MIIYKFNFFTFTDLYIIMQMQHIVMKRRLNPKRKCGKPIRFHQLKFLKGSGDSGEINGTDFDQYDRSFNGHIKPSFNEYDLLSFNDITCDIINNLNHRFNILPKNTKSIIFNFLFGKCNIDWNHYDFIDSDNYEHTYNKTIDNISDNEMFDFNSDETETDEDIYSEYSDDD